MTSLGLVLVVTALLGGAACAVFAMVVIGIRQGDRSWHLHGGHDTTAGAFTYTIWHRLLAERPPSPSITATRNKPGFLPGPPHTEFL